MRDQELLEKAAEAAGYARCDFLGYEDGATVNVYTNDGTHESWNPLTDDGDALRLAVKLKIDIKQYDDHVVGWFDGGYIGTGEIMYEGDPCAATRRAIVLAASSVSAE